MGLTLSASGANQTGPGPTSVTLTVPAGCAVGVLIEMNGGFGLGYFQGSCADTGGNVYTAAGGVNQQNSYYTDSFYCLNTGSSATSVTYTPSASLAGNIFSCFAAVWVWSVSGGVASFGTVSNNGQNAPGTGVNAITSGAVTCGAGSVVMGFNFDTAGSSDVTVGTGFTSDYSSFNCTAEHGAFSSNQAATWTSSLGTETASSNAMSFGLVTSLPAFVRQACVGDSGASAVLSQGGFFASATVAGSSILVVAKASTVGGNLFTGFSDAVNGGYLSLDFVADAGAFGQFKAYLFQNAASIGTSQALTVSASVSQQHLGFVAFEIQGVPITALAAHAAGIQTLASAAANAIASPTVQAGTGFAIAVAVSINTTQNNTTFAPSVGTGYTICPSPGGNFWLSSAKNIATAEFQTLTNPGGMNATFTPPGATSDDYVTFLAVFNQIGGAFVPPFTQTQFFVNDQYFQS